MGRQQLQQQKQWQGSGGWGRLAELAEVVEVGRQHSWYYEPKPDIVTCVTNSCLHPLYVSVVFSISLCAGLVGSEGVCRGFGRWGQGQGSCRRQSIAGGR